MSEQNNFDEPIDMGTNSTQQDEETRAGIGSGEMVRQTRGPVRVRAVCEIAGHFFSFPKGKRLIGERDSHDGTWTVWPASDPQAFIHSVGPECVRIIKPNAEISNEPKNAHKIKP